MVLPPSSREARKSEENERNGTLKEGAETVISRFGRASQNATLLRNRLIVWGVCILVSLSDGLASHMQDLDKQLVFYCNILGYVLFLLIICYFYLTSKPKDGVE